MNYKSALMAAAATITMGFAPALSTVNASTHSINSTYWTKQTRPITLKKKVTAYKYQLVTNKNGQKALGKVTNSKMTFKAGSSATIIRVGGKWALDYTATNKNDVSLYTSDSSKINKSTNWFVVNKTQANIKKYLVNGAFKKASEANLSTTDFTTAYVAPYSKKFTQDGVTIKPGSKQQVKLAFSKDSSNNLKLSYSFKVGDKTITAASSQDLVVYPYNVAYIPATQKSSTTSAQPAFVISTYAPNSKKAIVPKDFNPANGFQWITKSSFSAKTTKNYYIYQSSTKKWLKMHVSNGQLVVG